MTTDLPLQGVQVVVTRSVEQSSELCQAIERLGGSPVRAPLITISPRLDNSVMTCIRALNTYAAVVFTSANAVQALVAAALQIGVVLSAVAPVCYTVGKATTIAAQAVGLHAVFPRDVMSSQDLAGFLVRQAKQGRTGHLMLPRGQRADAFLPVTLRAAGYEVSEVVCYETHAAVVDIGLWDALFRQSKPTVITFYSPSAIHALLVASGKDEWQFSSSVKIACIGQTTAHAARRSGLPVDLVAEEPTDAGILDALCKWYAMDC